MGTGEAARRPRPAGFLPPEAPHATSTEERSAQLAGEWTAALQRVLLEPRRVRVDYQPIVDLERGVVRGYEALARFADAPSVPPRDWFVAAAQLGYGGALEAEVVQAALVSRSLLPSQRFMAINLSRTALISREVERVFAREQSLGDIVLEVPGTEEGADPGAVGAALASLRARGALLALDGFGTEGAHLSALTGLRPDIIKLDARSLVGLDEDRVGAGAALLDSYGTVARRVGASLVVKGIESEAMLDALLRRGVPFGQGFTLGRPQPALAGVPRGLAARIRQATADHVEASSLSSLLERVPTVPPTRGAITAAFAAYPGLEYVLCVDTAGRPNGVVDRSAHARGTPSRGALLVPGGVALSEAVRRVIGRPLDSRFDPLVCVDQRGIAEGVVPVDRLLGALVR